jgi:hypothetical protein
LANHSANARFFSLLFTMTSAMHTPAETPHREQLPPIPDDEGFAAPSPVSAYGRSRLLMFTGDDGLNVTFPPVEKHPGFPVSTLACDAQEDTWSVLDSLSFSHASVPAVQWLGCVVIPNGEVRQRVRTPEVRPLPLP